MGTRKRFVIFNLLLILFTPLFLSSCNLFEQTESINLLLPAWPPTKVSASYPKLSGWLISFIGNNVSESFTLPPETSSFQLDVNKNDFTAILAEPVTFSENSDYEILFFKPAGGIYPALCSDSDLILSWEGGYSAHLVEILYKSCRDNSDSLEKTHSFLSKFNWFRFNEKILEKSCSENDFFNPWMLNTETILQSITSGDFNAGKLNKTPLLIISSFQSQEFLNVLSNDFLPENAMSPYIPETEKIQKLKSIPVYNSKENRYAFTNDILLIINVNESKKLSASSVFLPKKIDRDSLCKKDSRVFY